MFRVRPPPAFQLRFHFMPSPRPRRSVLRVSVLRLLPAAFVACTLAAEPAPPLSDADLDRLLLGLDPWSAASPETSTPSVAFFHETTLTFSTGHRANVLYAARNELSSAYSRADLDWSAFAQPVNERWSAFASVQAELESFHQHRDQLSDQGFAVAVLGGDVRPRPELKTGLLAQAAYSDQYFGVGVSDTLTQSVRIVSTQWSLRPQAAWEPSARWRLGMAAPLEIDEFDPASENYTQTGLSGSFAWRTPRFETELAHTRSDRDYDSRPQRTRFGFDIVDSHLAWQIDETRLTTRLRLAPDHPWRARASLGHRTVADHAQGYDDHTRWDLRAGLDFEGARYDAAVELVYAHTTYDVQRVALLDPTLRAHQSGSAELRVGRRLNAAWRVVAAARWEDLASNRPGDDYTVHSVRLGLSWNLDNL